MSRRKETQSIVNDNQVWGVESIERLSACDNRPGLKMIYVTVVDKAGRALPGIKVRFDTVPSNGIVYDHPNWVGRTSNKGYVEWNHTGVPTVYRFYIGSGTTPLVVNIRTDLGYEYCKPPGTPWWGGHRPVNKPGVFSYRIKVRRKY